jgi:3-deoxy-D-manno-octulosonic-acid transferase
MLGERVYDLAAALAGPAASVAGRFSPKLARGVAGRRDTFGVLDAWKRDRPRPRAPVVWLHAPSVGEALMAQAIIAAMRERHADLDVAFTFFSPSAERVAERVGADVAAYMPWDTPARMRRALALLEPSVIAFVRTEIWPALVREAAAQHRRTALVNAVLAGGSSRLRLPGRVLLGPAYARLDAVGAVGEGDASRLATLGAAPSRIRVTGDARFDQVAGRVEKLDRDGPLLQKLRAAADGKVIVVAGSTWPQDEQRLIPAFASLRRDHAASLIIAPHEPSSEHITGLERRLESTALRHVRLSAFENGESFHDVIIVDRVGVLADLYALADVAWVGGGFGRSGLHSVVEPAALGVPVLYGPRHGNAGEAADLASHGGGFVITDDASARTLLDRLLANGEERLRASSRARSFVQNRRGGAAGNAELILELLDR